ncbi:TonB-dependent siderophore receptor [Asticcacaulis taihuensis]|uniref:Iron complex outermembrane recepter protein n=1 Tax=Asticcacaulis taihuensis TaxID=260084 RepID=A0A1G4S597_9CAUL|nr:TonB-dependent siderophore receptor [Asticcacaulis taihuensis]SCW64334.1 iron complex outermembrane recepter protein [Asticcacaulis taihuensis]
MLTQRTSINKTITRALLMATVATACIGGAAMAQQDDTGDGLKTTKETVDGSTVVIIRSKRFVPSGAMSANKTDIPLIRTPQSVSVINRDQIDLLGFTDLQQAVRYTSGAFGENYGPDLRYDFVTMRGFTPKQYVDGLAAPVTTTIFSTGVDLYAFDSASIIKGPAATLYGNSPPGGLYNETSRRASRNFGGEIQGKLGSYDYKSIAGTVTGALSSNVSARLTGLYLDRGAERDGVSAKRDLIAPTITWKITDNDTLTGLAYLQDDEVDGDTNGFLPVLGTLQPNPNGGVSESTNLGEPDYNIYKRNQWAVGYDYKHTFSNNLSFSSNAKYSKYRENSKVIYGAALEADNRTVDRYSFPYMENVESFAIDNRLDGTFTAGSVTHKVLAGIDYRDVKNFAQYGFAMASSIDLYNPVYSDASTIVTPPWNPYNDQDLKQTGLYVQDQIGINKLFITLGGRYDEDKIVTKTYLPATTTKDSKFTYRVGANYLFDNGVAPYASYSTSFEPVIGTGFRPTEGEQSEIGVKYDGRTLDNGVKLFATAALYDIKQTNVVSTVYYPTFISTQIGEVEVKGFETEFVARINEQFSINGSYTYTDSEVLASNNTAEIGGPMPTTPKDKVSLFADYTLKSGSLGGLGFGLGVRYNSKSLGSYGAGIWGQQSTLFDAAIHYDTPDWRIALNGSNITDVKYVARCSGSVGCTYGAGQNWTATLTRKF